ncbi:MAG: hypothetical protein C4B59_07580 [Candidatus Methanogaster sp.]|uniref:Uncharacterized protein n=1 Tax=Candidatus Methanogaster sp. TaxID=3386292 RepID=A0AC61L3N9_9EURY|nr:MAG: hypothetical protein C4B59_07580 [ANME-2 cluster archaeon]
MSKLIEKIIPGYGYRVQKDRLNSDRAVRDKLSRELKKSYNTLNEVGDLAYKDGRRDVLEHIKDLQSTIDLFRNEIENASYGLSPLFKEAKVSDDALDRMVEFDRDLFSELEVVTKATDLVYDHVLKGETSDIILQMRKVKRDVDNLRNIFLDRADFLMKDMATAGGGV